LTSTPLPAPEASTPASDAACEQPAEPPTPTADARRIRRADRMRQAIRSALAGVTLSLALLGAAFAESATYTVRPGDTLIDIAERHGVTSRDLVIANGLVGSDVIVPGQELQIPGETPRPAPASRSARTETATLTPPTPGQLVWPLQGVITTYFGEPGALWRRGFHPGLDIGAPLGSQIVAAGGGVVIESEVEGYNSGYGSYVKIDHGGGVHTLYAHLARVHLDVGDQVEAGEPVGTVGMTGFTTGPHLHMEVRVDGDIRDPLKWLKS
jgi:murein DD-endopeptidase MepM/ murein hydrolase activator NlpD